MELNVQVEKSSNILRKLTVRVPAKVVANRFERGLSEVQRTAKLKGFRPGHAPMSVIKQFYGEDVRHRIFHSLIEESYQQAVQEQNLKTVGNPAIDTPDHKTGDGDHDHSLKEDQDLTYTATVEVLPDVDVKGYTGVALQRENVEVKPEQVEQVVQRLRDSQAELIPAGGGLALADGSESSRPVQKSDYVDIAFSGGLVTDAGLEEHPGMKGSRLLEVGSDTLIPGFEDNLVGMRKGETKTFRVKFPEDYHEQSMLGKEAEFTVSVNEVKEKKLPELNDEFAKQMGYEGLDDLRKKAHEHLLRERTSEIDQKLRSDLLQAIIEKNSFDVPQALVESQTRALAQEWAEELKRQNVDEKVIKDAIVHELENLKKRAESQVRASLLLEAIAKKESIEVSSEEIQNEIQQIATNMKVEDSRLQEYYAKNPGRKEDLAFRLRQERTLKFLLDKAKIKSKT